MAFTDFFSHEDWLEDYDGAVPVPVPPGYHERHRFVVRRRRPDLRRRRCAGWSPSTHRRSRQVGPVPLPFAHRRTAWR